MKFLLYLLAAVAFIAPVLFWAYIAAMACAFVTNSNNSTCGVELSDFWDEEFPQIAIVPWAFGMLFAILGYRIGQRAE